MNSRQSTTVTRPVQHVVIAALFSVVAMVSTPSHAAFPQLFGKGAEAYEAAFANVHLAQPCSVALALMPSPPDAERVSKVTATRVLAWRAGDVTFEVRCFAGHVLNTTRTVGSSSFFSTK